VLQTQLVSVDDIIQPKDLVRRILPISYFEGYSTDEGQSTLMWYTAQFRITYCVGKTLRQVYEGFLNKDRRHVLFSYTVIRVPENTTKKELLLHGILLGCEKEPAGPCGLEPKQDEEQMELWYQLADSKRR
jgi:hypothetical protein